jgi:hypothetical protein
MIKVEVVSAEQEPVKFPILAKGLTTGVVVIFNSATRGMVLETGTSDHSVGQFNTSWSSVTKTNIWKILPPEYKITISNASV